MYDVWHSEGDAEPLRRVRLYIYLLITCYLLVINKASHDYTVHATDCWKILKKYTIFVFTF